jgi:tetraacyldisaccharide 4'-kinase
VSVGNITCGGTGKTPAAERIARDLLSRGLRPAFLSRGYGAGGGARGAYVPGGTGGMMVAGETIMESGGNDELLVLARNLPEVAHFQGKDRYEAGLAALAWGAEVLILDDGFQHVRLHRDLDLVLIDALDPFGGGHPLPRGLLREPLGELAAADLLAITRSDQVDPVTLSTLSAYLRGRFPSVPQLRMEIHPVHWESLGGRTSPPETLRGRRVFAFCGIGNPESFRRQLLALGAEVAGLACFRDHHRYTAGDLEGVCRRARELGAAEIVMTQKDAVKIPAQGREDWRFLRVEQRIVHGAEEYGRALKLLIAGRGAP